MNLILQNHWVGILLFLLFIIFILMIFIFYIFLNLLNRKPLENLSSDIPPSSHAKKDKIVESNYCLNHHDILAIGTCLICEEVFCDLCLADHESMHFCKEHFKLYASNNWKQITDIKTTPDTPEEGLHVYNFKRNLWRKKNTPSFVITHYKINIENDYIESFIQLNVREFDAETLTLEIQKYKAQD